MQRKVIGLAVFIAILGLILEAAIAFFEHYGAELIIVVLSLVTLFVLYFLIRYIRKELYFASDEFKAIKKQIASVVEEHNEISNYVSEIRTKRLFLLGSSSAGSQAHLASFENTSKHKFRRDRNTPEYSATNVHNCSLQVVRNASADPIRYLMKYFEIKANEDTLAEVEEVGESISRLQDALSNLEMREQDIKRAINPPAFILKHYAKELFDQVGVELSPVCVPYSDYVFEYVSAGGNSSQRTKIRLDLPTIDALVETLAEKIKFRKSAKGQRALMTTKFREFIKQRDRYACKQCSVSLAKEPHLLLEVDHIIPISRGGLSVEDNLQTLCWRCNRTKSNKMPA